MLTFAGLNVTMAIGRFLAGLSSSATAERQCCAQPAFWHVQGWGGVVFSKSTLIALLGALADGDALENIRPLEEPDRYFRVIVRNGEIYKNKLPGENPVRATQS